jgi:hypothetical protein
MNVKILAALSLAAVAVVVTSASEGRASNYPPDYPMCSSADSVTNGPFEIIRHTTNPYASHHANLTVAYRGYLRALFPDDQIHIYVNLNGNDASLPAKSGSNNDAYVFLNAGINSCYMCIGYQSAPGSECQLYIANGGSDGSWLCKQPTATESNLFLWAYGPSGTQNAWDIQVAAEAGGYWDSNYGQNYYARFEPRTTCN